MSKIGRGEEGGGPIVVSILYSSKVKSVLPLSLRNYKVLSLDFQFIFNYRELLSEYRRFTCLNLSGTYEGEPCI